uniref:Ribosomal protein L13 n=1 Tax=Pterothamnion crispum TaxID=1550583 RepID=A0A4D6X3F4_9FLOR|nr:ribosomal protein L13 [Pterothamnion crispum]
MDTNKTYIQSQNKENQWYIIDAKNQNLGRLSTEITTILLGKKNITYTPYTINKAYVIVTNSKLISVTGLKKEQKLYKRHSGRPGSLKVETLNELQERLPNRIIEQSVKGMLPKSPLGRQLFRQLKIYEHSQHPHKAQKPNAIILN